TAGWLMDDFIKRLEHHPERNKRFFWLSGVSDEYLEKIYDAATCLVTASVGEGFGLPLIESAQHGLPIIARDIPVFREVAGNCAQYFSGDSPDAIVVAVKTWLAKNASGQTPEVADMPWLTWEQSANQLKKVIFEDHWMT
ncbi:MAG: glycosyltransferase, partial [Zwartia sp.]